jgi:hypothetical protein
MQIAPSGIFLFRLLLNKALPLDAIFCFFGVFSLNLAPFVADPQFKETSQTELKLAPFNTCILILIVEMASEPFSDFYAGQRSFRLK